MRSLAALLLACVLLALVPAARQAAYAQTVKANPCSVSAGRDIRDSAVTVICGYTPEQVRELI